MVETVEVKYESVNRSERSPLPPVSDDRFDLNYEKANKFRSLHRLCRTDRTLYFPYGLLNIQSDVEMLTVRALLVHDTYCAGNYAAAFHIHCALGSNNHSNAPVRDYCAHRYRSLWPRYLTAAAAALDERVIHLTFVRHSQRQPMLKSMPYYRKPDVLATIWPAASHVLRPMNTMWASVRSFV